MAQKKNFKVANGIEATESFKLGNTTVTSFIDSSAVSSIGQEPTTSSAIVAAVPGGAKPYDSADLLPLSGNTAGDLALVSSTERLYIWNGSGWYNIALVNTTPTLSTTPDSNYTLDSVGASLTVTMVASDPEELPITYSYVASDSASDLVSITQDSGVFTISSLTQAQLDSNGVGSGGTFSITFRASDGVNIAPAVSSFTLTITSGADWTTTSQQAKIQLSSVTDTDLFGYDVGLSDDGDTAVITAVREDTGGTDAGSAYVYTRSGSTWSQQQQIQGSDTGGNDLFGYRAAISGDGQTIMVGNNNPNDAEAYIFTVSGSTWSQQTKISTGLSGYHRAALDYDGNTLVIGGSSASAQVYTRSGSTWSSVTNLGNSGSKAAISKDGNTIALGKEGTNTVYVYVYANSTWSLQASLSPSTFSLSLGSDPNWGCSVGLSENGNDLVIGAYGTSSDQGSVYVCTRSGSTWSLQTSSGLTASDGAASAKFGYSADMSNDGNTILIGARTAGTGGKIYVFTRDGSTWTEQFDGTSGDIESGDNLSFNVTIAGDVGTIIAGAANEDTGATSAGAAYVFTTS